MSRHHRFDERFRDEVSSATIYAQAGRDTALWTLPPGSWVSDRLVVVGPAESQLQELLEERDE